MKNIKFISICLFLLLADVSFSQDFPTIGEVYDYDIGDIFHKRIVNVYGGGDYPLMIDTILKNFEVVDKYFSPNLDTVWYEYFIKKQEMYNLEPQNNNYSEYNVTSFVANLELIRDGDTVFENPDVFNGRKTVKYYRYYIEGPDEEIISSRWTVGCGMTYHHRWRWSWYSLITQQTTMAMVYFKKGDEEWGEEQTVVRISEFEFNSGISIYPNPAYDFLNITFVDDRDKVVLVKIFNVAGQLVESYQIFSLEERIDVSSLPDGLYFLSQVGENGQVLFNTNFIKVH